MKQETLKTLEKLLTGLVVMDFKKEAEEKIQNCLKEVKEAINYNRCSTQLQAVEDLKEFARNNCREWNVEEMEQIIDRL